MPGIIDPERINVDVLPGIWTPIQWKMSEEEHQVELEAQGTASLLWSVDIPVAILRMLLSETKIERSFSPPPGFNPELQGEWKEDLVAFKFARAIKMDAVERTREKLTVAYDFGELGYWCLEIEPEKVTIERM